MRCLLFVIGHLLGNLQIFLGPEAINRYGHFLQSTPELIWPARIGLLVLAALHICCRDHADANRIAPRARSAYGDYKVVAASYASRTMLMSGLIVLVFIIYHLLHFTVQTPDINFTGQDFRTLHDDKGRHDVYRMMILGFKQPLVSLFYVIGDGAAVPAPEPWRQQHVSIDGLEEQILRRVPGQVRHRGVRDRLFVGYISIPARGVDRDVVTRNEPRRRKIPSGPLGQKWDRHRFELKLVNPANKRKYDVIVVGSGLAGASAAATLAELGYKVKCFCFQDSPRRAHSIAAQGGINAAKNYQNDGDSVYRLFYDTIKGGDFRAREANVYRLAQVSVNIIDQCVAQGVPFAREYGGLLANRSFGGAQVSRTFYARGQTGQQLLLGAYQALCRQIGLGTVKMFPRTEMLDVVVVDGHAKGIVVRDLVTRRNHLARGRCGGAGDRRLRQRFLIFRPTRRVAT